MHLVTEFQCLHRLPKTKALVFTIHKYIDPLSELESSPEAADMMARSFAAKSEEQLDYALGTDREKRDAILEYVESIAERAGLGLCGDGGGGLAVAGAAGVMRYHHEQQERGKL